MNNYAALILFSQSTSSTAQESIRILNSCLTELLKHGDQFNVARCALLLGRLLLLEITDDRTHIHCKAIRK